MVYGVGFLVKVRVYGLTLGLGLGYMSYQLPARAAKKDTCSFAHPVQLMVTDGTESRNWT